MSGWRDDALCREVDLALFYPERGESVDPAKRVCRMCTVRTPCLTEALAEPVGQDFGIRGGVSEYKRRKIRRARKKTAALAAVITLPALSVPERRAA